MSPVVTREEVRRHNNEKNLWMVIHNDVYDVTKFLNEHPGGADALTDFAGKDATLAFENVGHSDDARVMMRQYKVGTIVPGEQSSHAASCEKGSQTGSQLNKKECTVCHVASCPGLKKTVSQQKSWRTFDGPSKRPKTPHSGYAPPPTPRVERRVQTIVVPRERERIRRRPPPPSGSNLKWLLLALGAAVVIGVVMKKYMT